VSTSPPPGGPPHTGGAGGAARQLALGCAAAGTLLALACLAGAALLSARPPAQAALFQPIVVHAGSFGLSLAVSGTPDCPPEIVDCSVSPQPDRLYGSLWFWVTTRNPTGVTSSFKPLLRLRLR
jgi:hypothetical protein